MKLVAFGSLQLTPDEFWNLTLVEFSEMVEAFVEEEKRKNELEMERFAWLASHLMNATGNMKSQITPDKLLGRNNQNNTGEARKLTAEERKRELDELKKKFEH